MAKISQRRLVISLVFVLLMCIASSAGSQEFSQYCNDRYGFCITYPTSLMMDDPPFNGDGRKFYDSEGFLLIVSGINNVLDNTLEGEMKSTVKDIDKITYRTKGKNWFILSGYKGSDIVYLKTYVGEGAMNHLYIKYPANQKSEYAEIVTKISRSFKPGDLSEKH